MDPATELVELLATVPPGRALDLACGRGRHAIWLRDHGWKVTAVDLEINRTVGEIPGVTCLHADLERGEFTIEAAEWDLIVCWLYWQENLLPSIAAGVRKDGIVALAGKISGRFATSLYQYRETFAGWDEIRTGEDDYKVVFIAQKPE